MFYPVNGYRVIFPLLNEAKPSVKIFGYKLGFVFEERFSVNFGCVDQKKNFSFHKSVIWK